MADLSLQDASVTSPDGESYRGIVVSEQYLKRIKQRQKHLSKVLGEYYSKGLLTGGPAVWQAHKACSGGRSPVFEYQFPKPDKNGLDCETVERHLRNKLQQFTIDCNLLHQYTADGSIDKDMDDEWYRLNPFVAGGDEAIEGYLMLASHELDELKKKQRADQSGRSAGKPKPRKAGYIYNVQKDEWSHVNDIIEKSIENIDDSYVDIWDSFVNRLTNEFKIPGVRQDLQPDTGELRIQFSQPSYSDFKSKGWGGSGAVEFQFKFGQFEDRLCRIKAKKSGKS